MAVSTQEYFEKYSKEKERTSAYILGSKFNTQAGNKENQDFFLRLLPRIPNSPGEFCEGPFYNFFVHFDCGADGKQSMVCLNRTREEFKSNKMKCPACTKIRKVLNNEDQFRSDTVDKCKKQRAKDRVLWVAYDLSSKKECEALEVSGQANDEIIKEFQDSAGVFYDLTKPSNPCCLKVSRSGSGFNSKYHWRGLVDGRFALQNLDVEKIKKSYKHPELWVKRLSPEEFKDIFESAFEVEMADGAVDQSIVPNSVDSGDPFSDMKGPEAAAPTQRSRGPAPAQPSAQVADPFASIASPTPSAQVSNGPAQPSSDQVADLEKELNGMGM